MLYKTEMLQENWNQHYFKFNEL